MGIFRIASPLWVEPTFVEHCGAGLRLSLRFCGLVEAVERLARGFFDHSIVSTLRAAWSQCALRLAIFGCI